jgi:hypothetical protein
LRQVGRKGLEGAKPVRSRLPAALCNGVPSPTFTSRT